MLSRFFTLIERIARLTVRGSVWLGNEWLAGVASLSGMLRPGKPAPSPSPAPDERQQMVGQVRSLSGLIIGLLAAVVLLLLWATSPRASVSPVVNLFNLITPPAEGQLPAGSGDLPVPANPLQAGGTVAFTLRLNGQDDIYALTIGETEPLRLTSHPADDRDGVWSPDGERLAFASRRDGNWELYVLDVISGETTRLTNDIGFDAGPSWSPDGAWLAFEAYRENNLDIYIMRADGTEGPFRLTFDAAPDFAPAWSSSGAGREIAYVSWRDGNREIFILSLDDPREDTAINVTNTRDLDEDDPAWSPGGQLLAYSAEFEGTRLVYAKQATNLAAEPLIVGQGYSPAWSPGGASLIYAARQGTRGLLLAGNYGSLGVADEAVGLPAPAADPDWTAASLPRRLRGSIQEAAGTPLQPGFEEVLAPPDAQGGAPYKLINLEGVDAPVPWLSDRVNDSFAALRNRVAQEAGWDVLGRADHVFWDLERRVEPGQNPLNWHKAGRAFDLVQGYIDGQTPLAYTVLDQEGASQYWRIYVRAAQQDGTQGEPLRELPWDFTARFSGTDVEAYDRGGRYLDTVPAGYYVDFTLLAEDYGWARAASDSTWRSNWPGVMFWQYEKRDGLEWNQAMLEIYLEEELGRALFTPTPLPPPTPGPTPTFPPTATAPEPEATPTASPDAATSPPEETLEPG